MRLGDIYAEMGRTHLRQSAGDDFRRVTVQTHTVHERPLVEAEHPRLGIARPATVRHAADLDETKTVVDGGIDDGGAFVKSCREAQGIRKLMSEELGGAIAQR